MGENNKNENVHVERLDNTQVRRPILLKRVLKASPAQQIESYLKIYGVPQLPVLSADTRTPELKEIHRRAGELELYRLKEEKQKLMERQLALGIGTAGIILGSLFTPAAPYVNAALAANGAINLATQYYDGTLGFNPETALNTLSIAPFGIKTGALLFGKTPLSFVPRFIDLTKNVVNRYTAPRTTIKMTPFKGDHLALVKERLANGGYDKLGIGPDDYIALPVNHPLASLGELIESAPVNPINKGPFFSDFMNTTPSYVKINARLFLNELKAILDPNDFMIKNGGAYYSGLEKIMKSPMFGKYFKVDQNYKNLATSHEFWHAVDDVLLNINKPAKPLGISIFEKLAKPTSTNVPGISFEKIPSAVLEYFKGNNFTELKARLMQLKNYFGIKNSNLPITVDLWNYARRHYVSDTGSDNNMLQLFRAVTNPKEFLDWINPKVASTIGLTSIGTQELLNNEKFKN